ncbi:hypothetical protein [Flavobacterium sp. 7A]|uniref:hypothetical protein n=1 Tax=Flavobacterium sp. 7A TaxID=2940571 RepID=UPI0022275EFB|nr:hypothetical protein [Flavobacterium sp. 7A]MCW2119852.1 hypothetical protein [Flavobacterium sp. 7A]
MKPLHILDEKLDNISFAFSMRVLESDYEGPLIRLRKARIAGVLIDEEKDFGWADNDIVDVAAIDAWRGTSEVYVTIWYDQSGLGRNAVQTNILFQPVFYTNTVLPYFQGDGINDFLTVSGGGIQVVTTNGVQGTVIGTMRATNRNQHSFGVLTGSDRWSSHVNWSDGSLYFDPGFCCNNPRSFNNSGKAGFWDIYTFIKTATNAIVRSTLVERFNGTHTSGRCTRTENFAICWAAGDGTINYATTGFNELIMYKTDIAATQYQEIESDSKTFWGI